MVCIPGQSHRVAAGIQGICAVFRGTGPKSGGPVPDLADRSHKNDFYGTGPIKITFMGPVPNYTLFLWTGPIKMVWTTLKQPHY